MVIDKNIGDKFKEYFGLNFEKYRDDAYSSVCGRDCVDTIKMYDYLLRKYKFTTSMVECIEKEYGKECREWWEKTFCGQVD
jgi:hypothetical protein